MSKLYHWESIKINGAYEQIQSKWWIRVDCRRYGVAPDMLEGRCITVKGERKRLGHLADNARPDNARPDIAYFRPWEVQDFVACGVLARELRALWTIQEPVQRDKAIAALRGRLKDLAARIRAARAYDAAAPSITGWQRWALEPLDELLCRQAAQDLAPLPLNQFELVGWVNFSELFSMFAEQPKRRWRA